MVFRVPFSLHRLTEPNLLLVVREEGAFLLSRLCGIVAGADFRQSKRFPQDIRDRDDRFRQLRRLTSAGD